MRVCSVVASWLFYFLLPAVPGVVLWLSLKPVTFWQKLAIFTVGSVLYFVIFSGLVLLGMVCSRYVDVAQYDLWHYR